MHFTRGGLALSDRRCHELVPRLMPVSACFGRSRGIAAAVNSYQDRYRALPGDDLNAGTRWTTTTPALTVYPGNGNGVFGTPGTDFYNLAVSAAPSATTVEVILFWWHLRLAGFVGGTTGAVQSSISQPNNAANGMMGVQTSGMGFTSNIVCSSNLPDKIGIAVDTQMDDGTSTTGQVRGLLQTAPNPVPGTTAPTVAYQETGTNQYLLCKNL